MQTVIIDRKGSVLALDGKRMRVEVPDATRPQFIPLAMVERVVVSSKISLDSSLLTALGEQGSGVLLLSPRDHRRTAIILPPGGRDHALRLEQYSLVSDVTRTLPVVLALVRRKIAGQHRVLRSLHVRGKGPRYRTALRTLPGMMEALDQRGDSSIQQIRGHEGAAASLYFQALAEALPASLGFPGRKKRPPPDPLNALLSLGYTLLHFDAVRILLSAGFDPALGMLHEPTYSRESLACDAIEPLRPLVDRFALGMLHHRHLRTDHFVMQQGACKLGKEGRCHFYAHWERFARQARKILRKEASQLREHCRVQL